MIFSDFILYFLENCPILYIKFSKILIIFYIIFQDLFFILFYIIFHNDIFFIKMINF